MLFFAHYKNKTQNGSDYDVDSKFSFEHKSKAVSPFFIKFRIPKDVGVNF